MSNIYKTLLAVVIIVGALSGCDIIEAPYKVTPTTDTTQTDTTTAVRKVLLEEFTGHKCGNCPAGAEKAHELKDLYGNRLVLLSIHAGYFATVTPNSQGHYQYDFRTTKGTEIGNEYNIETAGTPNGLVNRTGNRLYGINSWASIIDSMVQAPASAKIKITTTVDTSSRLLRVTVLSTFVQPVASPKNLTVFLTESGFINWQKDYRKTPEDIENYEHNNFLRATLTNTWGNELTTSAATAGQTVTKQFTYTIPPEYNIKKCKVIAVINDPTTHQVLQAEDTPYLSN